MRHSPWRCACETCRTFRAAIPPPEAVRPTRCARCDLVLEDDETHEDPAACIVALQALVDADEFENPTPAYRAGWANYPLPKEPEPPPEGTGFAAELSAFLRPQFRGYYLEQAAHRAWAEIVDKPHETDPMLRWLGVSSMPAEAIVGEA